MKEAYKVKPFRWGTITSIRGPRFSLGVHVDLEHRCIDLHLFWWIIGIGGAVYELEPVE